MQECTLRLVIIASKVSKIIYFHNTCIFRNAFFGWAGPGVENSFSFFFPAILSNEKTIVSTASIALQDQLINKDLFFLQRVLPQRFSFAILKGKNNYLCLKREREFAELTRSYKKFREWVSMTKTGDKDELSFIPDFWARVCGDSDDCSAM